MAQPSWIGYKLNGRYEIVQQLGSGGMSAVFKANDPNLKRVVAIKLIHPHLSQNREFIRRFEVEAAAVGQLRHPHIVQVYDFDHDGDTYFMVLEYVPGDTLQQRLRRLAAAGQKFSLDEVIALAGKTCDAVEYAHKRGLVHRDIKPANVMLNADDEPVLMDFGIVKILGDEHHTATGAVVGTALYMSPEQIRGDHPDFRADIYSLGVILYEIFSGQPPFAGDSAMTIMMKHLHDPVPDILTLSPNTPPAFKTIIEKALAKSPADRFQSAGELARAIRAAAPLHTRLSPPIEIVKKPAESLSEVMAAPTKAAAPAEKTALAEEPAASLTEAAPPAEKTALGEEPVAAPTEPPPALEDQPPVEPAGTLLEAAAAPSEPPPAPKVQPPVESAGTLLEPPTPLPSSPQTIMEPAQAAPAGTFIDIANGPGHAQQTFMEPAPAKPAAVPTPVPAASYPTTRPLVEKGGTSRGLLIGGAVAAVLVVIILAIIFVPPLLGGDGGETAGGATSLPVAAVGSTTTKAPTDAPATQTPVPPTATGEPAITSTVAATEFAVQIQDDFGVSMVLIPAGTFQMGSEAGGDEGPIHTVHLDAFYMDQYEVTNALYTACVDAGVCVEVNTSELRDASFAQFPVRNVEWDQARIYCEWREGSLPTEAQWEKAARGGLEGMEFPWGDEAPGCDLGAANGAQFASCGASTIPVGSFGPNGYGLYDMVGNVWEWAADWYSRTFYAESPDTNPTGPLTGELPVRRGGSWGYNQSYLRAANRTSVLPETYSDIGVRCARLP